MDERRLRQFFHFTEEDLLANRRGQFSEHQKKRLSREAEAEQASARSSAVILFVIAAAALAVGLEKVCRSSARLMPCTNRACAK